MTSEVIDTMTPSREDGPMQRALLRADVAFSSACGLSFVVLSPGLADWAELPTWVVLVVGVLVLAHAGILLVGVRRPVMEESVTRYAVVANLGWVAGAVVVVALGWLPEAPAGLFVVLSGVVGLFGALQAWTLRGKAVRPPT
jgi:hypothetical protein